MGSIQMEVNTFSPILSTIDDFKLSVNEKMLSKTTATQIFMEEDDIELITSVYGNAVPSGVLGKDVFDTLLTMLTDSLKNAGKVDGVWLYLHGALEVEETGSGDLAIVKACRDIIGYNIPLAIALDFHANNDNELTEYCNIICGYRTAPHTDMSETQDKTARLLLRCIHEKILPVPHLIEIPAIIAGDSVITNEFPYEKINERLKSIDLDDRILNISFFIGQNWADTQNNRATVITTALPGCEETAVKYNRDIASLFWDLKSYFRFAVPALMPEEALQMCMKYEEKPVFISDSGDNVTAGAEGKSVFLLKTAYIMKVTNILFSGIYNLPVYEKLSKLPAGEKQTVRFNDNFEINVFIKAHSHILGWDGEYAGGGVLVGTAENSAVGIDIIITQNRCAFISPEIITSAGANIDDYHIIAVKLGYLYPGLAEISRKSVLALTPGTSCVDLKQIRFTKIKRPCYPFDSLNFNPWELE